MEFTALYDFVSVIHACGCRWIRVKVGQCAALVLVLCRVICAQVMECEPAGKYLFLDCLVQQLPLEQLFDAVANVARARRRHDFDLLDYLAAPLPRFTLM